MKLFSLWRNKDAPDSSPSNTPTCTKTESDKDYYHSWDAYQQWLNLHIKAGVSSYKNDKRYNASVLCEYFDSPLNTPQSLLLRSSCIYVTDIVIWAVKENRDDILSKIEYVSYPVLDIVKSVLRCPDDWDVKWELTANNSKGAFCLYKGNIVISDDIVHNATFSNTERSLLAICSDCVCKNVAEKDKNKKREEFNNTWKELNE